MLRLSTRLASPETAKSNGQEKKNKKMTTHDLNNKNNAQISTICGCGRQPQSSHVCGKQRGAGLDFWSGTDRIELGYYYIPRTLTPYGMFDAVSPVRSIGVTTTLKMIHCFHRLDGRMEHKIPLFFYFFLKKKERGKYPIDIRGCIPARLDSIPPALRVASSQADVDVE